MVFLGIVHTVFPDQDHQKTVFRKDINNKDKFISEKNL